MSKFHVTWPILARWGLALLGLSFACSEKGGTPSDSAQAGDGGAVPYGDAGTTLGDSAALYTADGAAIAAELLRCGYSEETGAVHSVHLGLQYLRDPEHVAFAAYIEDPMPAAPFEIEPHNATRFNFEAFQGDVSYSASLRGSQIMVHLDALPAVSTLHAGDVVHLHGRLDIGALSLPATSTPDESEEPAALAVTAGSVPIDCQSEFSRSVALH